MTYDVIFSHAARNGLEAAAEWYRERSGSTDIADHWLRGFVEAILSLDHNPQRCGIAHESDRFPIELRELLYGSGRRKTHRAIYCIEGGRVEVIAIRHVAQRDLSLDGL